MAIDSSSGRYRVVGTRADRTPATLARGLTISRALSILEAMSNTGVFAGLRIERETEHEIAILECADLGGSDDEWDG